MKQKSSITGRPSMDFRSHTFSNGLKIVHKYDPCPIAHCGLIIRAGSRDEDSGNHGIAHFIEHVLFKGTRKRKTHHILRRLEDVGGELNAYTTKEETCIHAAFMPQYYERAIELLCDILCNSTFPETEIQKEKEVVIDEINSYRDNPGEIIFDHFEEILFPNNALGRNILGTVGSIKKIKRKDIIDFIKMHYTPNRMVFASIGNIDFDKLVNMLEKYFGRLPRPTKRKDTPFLKTYKPQRVIEIKNTHQCHCIIGVPAYNLQHKNRFGMFLLNNLLGGPGLSARLNMILREKYGLCYAIESVFMPYIDTGAFMVYIGGDKKNMDRNIELVLKEFKSLSHAPLSQTQLNIAKKQISGQIAISSENKESLMLSAGKTFLTFNKIDSFDEIYERINEITAEHVKAVASEILKESRLSFLIYK